MNLSSSAAIERVEQFAFNSITHPLTNTARLQSLEIGKGRTEEMAVCWLK